MARRSSVVPVVGFSEPGALPRMRAPPTVSFPTAPSGLGSSSLTDLDTLLRTPLDMQPIIHEINDQIAEVELRMRGGKAYMEVEDEDDDDDETTQTEAEGSMGYYKDPQGPRIDMGFDTFLINTLLYEMLINLFVPFSVVYLYLVEGPKALRSRDLLGITKFPGWFILMGQYVMSSMTWLVLYLVLRDPGILGRERLDVDFVYAMSCVLLRNILVAYKWATVCNREYYAASSERRREIEIIFGWLAFTKQAAVRQCVKTLLHCRIGGEQPVVVMPQETSLSDFRRGDAELVQVLANASMEKAQKLGALTQRLSPATSRPMSPNGLGRNDFYSSTSNGANLNLNNNNSHFERRSSGGMGSPLPYNARHAATRNGPLNRRGSAQSDNGMGAESLDPNNRGSNAEDEEFDRDVEALLNGQAPRRPTIDAGRPPQRPSLPSIQPPQQPPPQSPQQPLSQLNPLQPDEPPQGPVVSWPDSVGQRPDTAPPNATQAPPQTARPQPPPVSGSIGAGLSRGATKGPDKIQNLAVAPPGFKFQGFGRAFNLPLTRVFCEIVLRGGMKEHMRLRILLRVLWAMASAFLPLIIRAWFYGQAVGEGWKARVICFVCAGQIMMINFNFCASFLDCCLVTYARLLYYMRELLALSTQDPTLLELTQLPERGLAIYMPLCLRANLVGWLRLRRALFRFGMNFRRRIQVFFALVLFRLLCFVLVIFKDAVTQKTYSPVLAAVTSLELAVLTIIIMTIVLTGIRIHLLMDEQLLQLKHLRLDWHLAEMGNWDKVAEAAVAERYVVDLVVDYAESDRRLNGLALLGVPMDGRALINIMAAVIPLFSAMYYLSRLINYAS